MNRAPDAIVLYEDSQRGPTFELHRLVAQCICDELQLPLWSVLNHRTHCRPLGGVSNVVKALTGATRMVRQGQPLLLLIDADKAASALGCAASASRDELQVAARARAPDVELSLFLLDRNLESLLDAIADCHADLRPGVLERAKSKHLEARDSVLSAAAAPGRRAVRDCVRTSMPGFGELVEALVGVLS